MYNRLKPRFPLMKGIWMYILFMTALWEATTGNFVLTMLCFLLVMVISEQR